jgi:hypothetical protein
MNNLLTGVLAVIVLIAAIVLVGDESFRQELGQDVQDISQSFGQWLVAFFSRPGPARSAAMDAANQAANAAFARLGRHLLALGLAFWEYLVAGFQSMLYAVRFGFNG